MKFFIRAVLSVFVIFLMVGGSRMTVLADNKVDCVDGTRGCYNNETTPLDVLDDLVKNDSVIQTDLDTVNTSEQRYGNPGLKISETANSVRTNMSVYLQWIAFIGLTGAVLIIMYNGIRLMFSPLSPEEAQGVKKRLLYVLYGVLLLTGFYFLLSIFLSVYLDIFVK